MTNKDTGVKMICVRSRIWLLVYKKYDNDKAQRENNLSNGRKAGAH